MFHINININDPPHLLNEVKEFYGLIICCLDFGSFQVYHYSRIATEALLDDFIRPQMEVGLFSNFRH